MTSPSLGGELMPVLEQIERDKGIKKEDLLNMIETAMVSAYKKHIGEIEDVECKIDADTGSIDFFVIKKVVEKVADDLKEITLKEAKKLNIKAKVDDEIKLKTDTSNFGRIAAQTAKQVIIQRIRETEKENLYKEFKDKEGDVVNGQIVRIINENVIIDLGKAEGIMPKREQIPTDQYHPGQYLKVYIFKVDNTVRGAKILLSRTHPEFLRNLFALEVPEVYDKTVEIKAIVRDPGRRAKVSVVSRNPMVDPIGACVGVKGVRVKAVIEELSDEKIDLVAYNPDTKVYITNALNPAKISLITLDEQKRNAEVLVADDQLSLAIGRKGQNVRLAARLVGWHLDVMGESKREKEKEDKIAASVEALEKLPGIGDKTASLLVTAGYNTFERLEQVTQEELMGLQGIGEKMAEKILNAIKKYKKTKTTKTKKK